MAEPIRFDRKAPPGKFCIWIEHQSGAETQIEDAFDTESQAKAAAVEISNLDRDRQLACIIVYDDFGAFRYKLER